MVLCFLENIGEILVWGHKKQWNACLIKLGVVSVLLGHLALSLNVHSSLLPVRLGAVLTPAHLIDSTESKLVGSGRCEPAHWYLGHCRINLW